MGERGRIIRVDLEVMLAAWSIIWLQKIPYSCEFDGRALGVGQKKKKKKKKHPLPTDSLQKIYAMICLIQTKCCYLK
jgi:hypothetical protein